MAAFTTAALFALAAAGTAYQVHESNVARRDANDMAKKQQQEQEAALKNEQMQEENIKKRNAEAQNSFGGGGGFMPRSSSIYTAPLGSTPATVTGQGKTLIGQ